MIVFQAPLAPSQVATATRCWRRRWRPAGRRLFVGADARRRQRGRPQRPDDERLAPALADHCRRRGWWRDRHYDDGCVRRRGQQPPPVEVASCFTAVTGLLLRPQKKTKKIRTKEPPPQPNLCPSSISFCRSRPEKTTNSPTDFSSHLNIYILYYLEKSIHSPPPPPRFITTHHSSFYNVLSLFSHKNTQTDRHIIPEN